MPTYSGEKKSLSRFDRKIRIKKMKSINGAGKGNPRNASGLVHARTMSKSRLKRRELPSKKTPYYQVYG